MIKELLVKYLPIIQIVVTSLLIVLILLQQRSQGLGSAFGGGGGGFYSTRRGIQKKIFGATCFLGALFIILALLKLFL